ncbi:MAG TPA: MBL fold metallo-hydrolase, partial [Jiangellaceae bacterium]|nr:MBL fold metallo-hydrolase [Jiangellaceae bacterium]
EAGWIDAGGARVMLADIPHKGGRTFGIRVEADGASLAYLPDHDPVADPEPGAKLARGVDLLLHDGQFAESERDVAVAYGHATVGDAVELAAHAGVGRLVLIHHAPERTDDGVDELSAGHASGAAVTVLPGCEGTVVEL